MRRCFSLLAATLSWVAPVDAAIYRVGLGPECTHNTIQAAINTASATAENDEIRLIGAQYTGQALMIEQPLGELHLRGGYAGCIDDDPVPGQRTIVGGTTGPAVLSIHDAAYVLLESLDIRDAHATGNGGGIRQSAAMASTVSLKNTFVRGNSATWGGGVAVWDTAPDPALDRRVALQLYGNSAVFGNTSFEDGGGIRCSHAGILVAQTAYVALNQAEDGDGGGIHSEGCVLFMLGTGMNNTGAALFGNSAPNGAGGGLFHAGYSGPAMTSLNVAAPDIPLRIFSNNAQYGGAIALENGGTVFLQGAVVEQNQATIAGGAFWLAPDSSNTKLWMGPAGPGSGAPIPAIRCNDPEACNIVRNNRADNEGIAGRGSAIAFGTSPGSAEATFRGTRLEGNEGETLAYAGSLMGRQSDFPELPSSYRMQFDGAVIVENVSSSYLFDVASTPTLLTLTASTVANNAISAADAVIRSAGGCTTSGANVQRSIVWQPGLALIEATTALQPECARYVMASDFGALPASPERVVADPVFTDAAHGNYRPSISSPAIEFAPAGTGDGTRDYQPRVIDVYSLPNRFGPQDLGAYEMYADIIFRGDFEP